MDIVLVGCGNMGFAMLSAWVAELKGARFHVVEPSEALRERAIHVGAKGYASRAELPGNLEPAVVVLAVKPQVMGDVAPEYAGITGTFVSIAAGVTMAAMEGWLGPVPVVRTMPNTPAAIGQGMLVSVAGVGVSAQARHHVDRMMGAAGVHAWLEDEALMDADGDIWLWSGLRVPLHRVPGRGSGGAWIAC